ncbi:MAG: hypothetical protein IT198_01075 [Acidimicrobiia bacterium]|nr:hypothetical protein [Acidimicrobiia bacterium]
MWRWIAGSGVVLVVAVSFALLSDTPAQAAAGDGGLVWRRCTDNDCSRVENETAVYRRNGSAYLLPGFGGIGWKGTLRLRIAAAETHDGIPTVVDVNASLSWSWFSTTLRLNATAPAWQDAFGVVGLTLQDAKIAGSFNLAASNAPTLTVTATATLPQLWIYDFQVVVEHPVTFKANLDKSKPVIEMHVGQDDGDPSLRPLLRTSIPADNTIVAIDDASLVVAPNGGTAGGATYEPGIWLDFAGAIGTHPVGLSARYDDDARRLVGSGHLEQLSVGALTMSDWSFDFDLSPTFVDAAMSGSVEMAAGPTFDVSGRVFTTSTCDICVSFTGTAANVTLGAIDVETMEVQLDADLDASSLTASLDARLRLFDQGVQVGGNVTVQNGDLSRFDIAGSASPVCPKPGVCLTGPGPLGGPSFEGTYDASATEVFDIDFDGTLAADDLEISLRGHLDETGADFEGQLVLESIVNVSMSGHFFFGANLAGEQIRDRDGNLVQAQSGDWRADATGSVNTTLAEAKFRGDLVFDTGSVGGTEWVDAVGNVNVSNPARNTELDGSVSGSFSGLSGGMTDYTLHVVGSGRFRGLEASGTATIRPSTVTISATTYVPDLGTSISFAGNSTFNCAGGACSFTYHLA